MYRDGSKDRGIITVSQLVDLGLNCQISLDAIAHEVVRRQTRPLSAVNNIDAEAIFEDWRLFFKEYFSLAPDFSKIAIPRLTPETQDHTRVILMPEELAKNQKLGLHNWLLGVSKDILGEVYSHCTDLDKEIVRGDRHPENSSYAICVRDSIEADEKLKKLSAEQVRQMKLKTETFAERMMHGLKVWYESGQHLDSENITLCAGSWDSDGYVPGVSWRGGELCVDWFFPQDASPSLRARSAVS